MLVLRVCKQEQRKQSFLILAKENQYPLGLYQSPLTFFFTSPRFVLLNQERRFLFSTNSSLITQRRHLTSSAGMRSAYDSQRKWEKSVYVWNMDIFLTKTHGSLNSYWTHCSLPTALTGLWMIQSKWDCTSSCSIWTDQGLMWGSCL